MQVQTGQTAICPAQKARKVFPVQSLGEGYTVDDLKDALSGKQKARTHGKSQQVHDKKFSILIDIQAKLNAGKGAGYRRWATLVNLKQMAQVM